MVKKEPKNATTATLDTPADKDQYKTEPIPDAEPTPEELEAQAKENRAKWLKEQVDRLHGELGDARKELREVTAEWASAHSEAGSLKKQVEKKQADLNALVDDLDDAINGRLQPTLQFTEAEESKRDPEFWRTEPVETLIDCGLSRKVSEILTENGLPTIGHISDWSSSGKLLTDIEGIGPAKAENIEAALEEFWKRGNAQQSQEVPKSEGQASPDADLLAKMERDAKEAAC